MLLRDEGRSSHYGVPRARGRPLSRNAARTRLAFVRNTGALPSAAGTYQVHELRIASTTLPRDSDPEKVNVFLRPQPELFGR